jgi:hypothetical protein
MYHPCKAVGEEYPKLVAGESFDFLYPPRGPGENSLG